ncbi:hypothetical protein DIPPA_28990 [Diplonema papillatum]|nr:hypothetical protein DIPPA_28990 [Diplonema papillatum]
MSSSEAPSPPYPVTPTVPLAKKSVSTPAFATSVAATVESFYRSALNAFINSALLGQPVQRLLPNMHIQAPVRVMYINGIKQSRTWLTNNVEPDTYSVPTAARLAMWVGPGLLMTPVSSILEAANAGSKNPEPLLTQRWLRGIVARGMREIIFAIGVNQLSEHIEESIPVETISSGLLRNNIGSLCSGVTSGYLSHVPHNMSALKLHFPQKSYLELFKEYAASNESRLPATMSPQTRTTAAYALALIVPKALLQRTTQIVGTFVLLNGIIYVLKDVDPLVAVGWAEDAVKSSSS